MQYDFYIIYFYIFQASLNNEISKYEMVNLLSILDISASILRGNYKYFYEYNYNWKAFSKSEKVILPFLCKNKKPKKTQKTKNSNCKNC